MTVFLPLALGYDDLERYVPLWAPVVILGVICYFMWRTLKLMPQTKPQEISSSSKHTVTFKDVAGVDETKDELQEIVDFMSDPKRFKALGAKVPKGILLHGPPGTGKTLLAKAVAHESGATFLSQSASSFIEMFAGLGAARIRRLFKEARDNAPAIVFIDELDAVGAERGSDISGERDQTLNQLLVEMDGFNSQDNVVVMAASNLLEKLDKALLRPGRFDRQVFVPPPDRNGRVEILRVHTASKPLSGLTGADLANLANEAAILAGRAQREFIVQADFDNALERVVAGLESRKVITDHEKKVIAWHEAGHAVASELLPSVDKVQKVSIVPRGKALGYTLNLPQEDRYLKTRHELIDYMKVLLAGRVAEQITFGRITTGASDDLKRVTAIARSMIYDYAMGTHIRSHQIPGDDFTVSESLRQIRDEEVQAIAEEAYRGAHQLLSDHRDLLDLVAERLLENEMIEREEIKEIMEAHRERRAEAAAAAEESLNGDSSTPAEVYATEEPSE
jgi:cell division protease FtsH